MMVAFIRRWLMPKGYELLPIEVIEILSDAGMRGYGPAFGGNQQAVARAYHAARSAQNVLSRRKAMCKASAEEEQEAMP